MLASISSRAWPSWPREAAGTSKVYPRGRDARCLRDRVRLVDQRGGDSELSGMHTHAATVGERGGKNVQRASGAGQLDLASGQLIPGVIVPQIRRNAACQPHPVTVLFAGAIDEAECVQRLLEPGQACCVALGEARRETIEEDVDCPWRPRRQGCGNTRRRARSFSLRIAAAEFITWETRAP
jgi:hypothetical protein